MSTPVFVQLSKPGGGFYSELNGLDPTLAAEWEAKGRARIVEPNAESEPEESEEETTTEPATETPAQETEQGSKTQAELEAMTVAELEDMAAELEIVGRSSMRKAELVAAIIVALNA